MMCQQILVLHYSRQHSSNVEDSSYDSIFGWYVSDTSWILAQLTQHIVLQRLYVCSSDSNYHGN